ncbi:hypothetical protein [Alteraurantiacibacter buctensis]|uniref:Terminase n=1 Tax=Alteraurantiacibacter buctensis TaxID=1503981 RepID=A0A844YV59_9SPHN|nr:hypothetical protein [Alteraurantiacibacter buctensis]MXO70910.1 hypothetical protein [Alteraurantiacibacter buctensis]
MRKSTRIMPAYREGEREQLDRHWRGLFLDTLAETSNVSEAARRAGINPSRAYKVRREEAGFRTKWAAALAEGYAHLEMETLHRLRMGTDAGKDERKFDLANALRLLALHRQSVAQTAAQDSDDDEEAILAILHSRIEAARAREAKRLAATDSAPCNDD